MWKKWLKNEVNLENTTGKWHWNLKNNLKLKNNTKWQKMHYKITIFGACALHPRLIYWIAFSTSQGKKMTCDEKPGPGNDNMLYWRSSVSAEHWLLVTTPLIGRDLNALRNYHKASLPRKYRPICPVASIFLISCYGNLATWSPQVKVFQSLH